MHLGYADGRCGLLRVTQLGRDKDSVVTFTLILHLSRPFCDGPLLTCTGYRTPIKKRLMVITFSAIDKGAIEMNMSVCEALGDFNS